MRLPPDKENFFIRHALSAEGFFAGLRKLRGA